MEVLRPGQSAHPTRTASWSPTAGRQRWQGECKGSPMRARLIIGKKTAPDTEHRPGIWHQARRSASRPAAAPPDVLGALPTYTVPIQRTSTIQPQSAGTTSQPPRGDVTRAKAPHDLPRRHGHHDGRERVGREQHTPGPELLARPRDLFSARVPVLHDVPPEDPVPEERGSSQRAGHKTRGTSPPPRRTMPERTDPQRPRPER